MYRAGLPAICRCSTCREIKVGALMETESECLACWAARMDRRDARRAAQRAGEAAPAAAARKAPEPSVDNGTGRQPAAPALGPLFDTTKG